MRLIAIMAFLALLTLPCIAEPDNVTTGPYNITFDLGLPKDAYTIKAQDPKETESLSGEKETVYNLNIENESDSAQVTAISMTEYAKEQAGASASSSLMEKTMKKLFPSSANVASRDIDGKNGAIAKFTSGDITLYTAIYYPNAYLLAVIMSTYPWDEGTLSFLKTIHIEQMNETS